jgi:Putative DNA-binding domain
MISLRDTQRAVCGAVLSGDAACMAELVRDDGIPAEQRMQIYHNNNQIGFLDTLAATYPVIKKLGGDDWFAQTVRQYQLRFPSRRGDLQYAGDRFAEFLRAELSGGGFDYFVDVAALEWAYQEVLIAADDAPLSPTALSDVAVADYERLIFTPRHALRVIESAYPVLAIWEANQADGSQAPTIRLDAGPDQILIVRGTAGVELRQLSNESCALLTQFSSGVTLGAAAEVLSNDHPDFDLAVNLRQLIALQAFSGFRLRAETTAVSL